MDWLLFAQLIIQLGLPAAEKIFNKWSAGGELTAKDIQEVKDAAALTAQDRVKARLVAARIDPQSEEGKKFLALAG